ncbi:cytochrome c biogenesis protein ResB, partial [Clavibacter michiganensis]
MSRPSDHVDSPRQAPREGAPIAQPKLGFLGTLRWFWRQLTSMRTALFLLLLLAFAAIPGSLVPQRSSDPNGVTQFRADNPD